MKMSKKGFQLTEVPQLVIVFLVLAIVLGVGASVLTQVKNNDATSGSTTNLASTTATATNASAQTYNNDANIVACSSVAVYNGTNKKAVTSEFTFTSQIGSCTLVVTGGNNTIQGKTVQVNYTKVGGGYAYNITSTGLTSMTSLSSWQTTWVVIVAAAIILGIISRYLM